MQASPQRQSDGQVLARNFSFLMASQLVTWALALVAAVVIPRFLGAELVGQFHLANSVWAIGLVVATFGMNLAVVKAVARDSSRVGPLLATSIAARLLLFVPVSGVLALYVFAVGYSEELLVLVAIVGGATIVLGISDAVSAVLQGLDRMGAMAVALVLGRLVFIGGAVALLLFGYSINAVAIFAGVGTLVTLLLQSLALRRVRREIGDTSRLSVDLGSIRELLGTSAPYLWIALAIAFYRQVDTILISILVADGEVLGWYSVYDRLFGTFMFVPTVFMTAVYPTLSRLYDRSGADGGEADQAATPGDHNRLTQKAFQLMLLISVPLGLGTMVVARPIVVLLFGDEFENAAPVLAVGGVVISLTYLTTVLGMFLISMDRQRQWTWFIALGAVLAIPLDMVLVPFFDQNYGNGAIGGAAAYVVTETVMVCGAIYLLPRGALGPSSIWYAVRVVSAGLVMAAAVAPFRQEYLMVPITLGAVVYGVMVMLLRLVAPEDKALVLSRLPAGRLRSRGR